jgi:2-C-methyl-D-erythritol 4-phosphate cytidylyltransferase/2-C-methyl-D-erythritol 2,4-cyclodiphosphate synthase
MKKSVEGSAMISAIIPAAGSSRRMNSNVNKQYMSIAGQPVLTRSLLSLREHVGEFIILSRPGEEELCRECARPYIDNFIVIAGGTTRQDSVYNGLLHCGGDYVLVHDGNRPLVSADLVQRVIAAAREHAAAIPALPVVDTVKEVQDQRVVSTLPRHTLWAVQTPQVFARQLLLAAHTRARQEKFQGTDDASLVEALGAPVKVVPGEGTNLKITTPDDILLAQGIIREKEGRGLDYLRTGIGFDVHELVPGRDLVIGGVHIPFALGLLGHSDADVLLHALMDAMLGAAGLGDIGLHFPDTDPAWAGADSGRLLAQVNRLLEQEGHHLVNIDCIIFAQEPKLSPYKSKMQETISRITKLDPARINIKATTTEGLGFVGRGEGIAAQVVCTVVSGRDRRNNLW